ncbi:MAG: transcriptional regulator [Mucilaginibacter sp.]|nr:transcriptional regulator [Mucilaginibacter sp.]
MLPIDLLYGMNSKGNKPVPADDLLQKLGARIKSLREEKGFANYEVFAYEHDISRSQFGRYEKGQNLTFTSLVRVVEAFDMTLEEFFSEGFD